jgi:hypothetical protein
MNERQFFKWRPAAIILIVLGAVYGVFSPLNVWLGSVAAERGEQQVSRVLYSGAFWNAVVAVLCFASWRFIASRRHSAFLLGASCVAVALLIVMRVWIVGLLHGRNPFPLLEAILSWVPMLYVIVYAIGETKQEGGS